MLIKGSRYTPPSALRVFKALFCDAWTLDTLETKHWRKWHLFLLAFKANGTPTLNKCHHCAFFNCDIDNDIDLADDVDANVDVGVGVDDHDDFNIHSF